ncbi:MAG: hypothetical protein JXA54_07725 [Candidatus Heimdallarchaeota archaeon]|nr:hypothetical protein [Candidatus Heimdallarchaeota archaeon]
MMNWSVDPLLLDDKPMIKNQWLTANSLIDNKSQNKFLLQDNRLNLYTIMIRSIDFQAGNRLAQGLPYITLTEPFLSKLRETTLLLAERCHFYFQKTAIDYSIKKWQSKIINYLESQQRLPFPLFRLSDNWQQVLTQEYVPFQSARGEHFHLPTRLTTDLAYFLGEVIGDGHLNLHNVVLVDFSEKQMKYLQNLAQQLFGITGSVTGDKNIWFLHLNNKWLVRLCNFLTDQPITGKKYHALKEPLIFQSDDHLRWAFWSGALDADGSYKCDVSFCTSSHFFAQEFIRLLQQYSINYRLRKIDSKPNQGYSVNIKAVSKDIIGKYLKSRHPIKKLEYQNYLSKTRYKDYQESITYSISDYDYSKILTINGESFFDFSLLSSFHICHCAKFLLQVRKLWSWTQENLADYLQIPKNRLASYEYRDSIPLNLFEKLLPKLPNAPNNLMPFLIENKLTHFQSKRSTAQLDFQPNSELLNLVKKLHLRGKYLFLQPNITNQQSEIIFITEHFKLQKQMPIQNAVLRSYLEIFFKFNQI